MMLRDMSITESIDAIHARCVIGIIKALYHLKRKRGAAMKP